MKQLVGVWFGLVVAACGPKPQPVYSGPAAQQPQQQPVAEQAAPAQAPQPPADPYQQPTQALYEQLLGDNNICSVSLGGHYVECTPAQLDGADPKVNAGWKFTAQLGVSADGNQWMVDVSSVLPRAFGHRCDEYANYVQDLNTTPAVVVTCDDAAQGFVFHTPLTMAFPTPDWDGMMATLHLHITTRTDARKQLKKVHALR